MQQQHDAPRFHGNNPEAEAQQKRCESRSEAAAAWCLKSFCARSVIFVLWLLSGRVEVRHAVAAGQEQPERWR